MRKKVLSMIYGATLVATLSAGAVFAISVPSDYSRDVADGQTEAQAHADIAAYEKEVKDSESIQGQVDNGQVQVDQTVGPQESQMDDGTSGASGVDNAAPTTDSSGGSNQ